ncbi:Abi family protein [Proteiniclasticum ruminis]|uniref:Abi family protein n=1 Tax=Proteiniclasticum ruminis TaxID=398199 RepID=UPI0028A2D938|nr:Abi family protein [Proteiniclasticum ruminis]
MTKLSLHKQIEQLENRGVKFDLCNVKDAMKFLEYNTYYDKIISYSQNFPVVSENKYYKLDFAHLIELSTIDMHIRRFLMRICLDIEHTLKIQLLRDCNNNETLDDYNIVNSFFVSYPQVKEEIDAEYKKITKKEFQCSYLDQIYLNYYPNFSIAQLSEILTLGNFSLLYAFYYNKSGEFSYEKFLQPVRKIRNICAHNSCLIDSLKKSDLNQIKPNNEVKSYIGKFMGTSMKNKINTAVVHDITTVLYLFDKSVKSQRLKFHTYEDLKRLMEDRIALKSEYFKDHDNLKSCFQYFNKLVNHLYESSLQ